MPRPFLRLADPASLPAGLAHPVVAIGNFDGVHRGHRTLFAEAQALARMLHRPAAALTFAPHPRAFFNPSQPQFRLTEPDVQAALVAATGLDGLITLTFDAALAGLPAEAFIADILLARLGIAGAVVGADFHFGKGRGGTPASLAAAGEAEGFAVRLIGQVSDETGPVSSSRIRAALEEGDCATARDLLGYDWFVRGPVVHGHKRGRALGYPTANMALEPGCRLRHGVYAVRARVDGVWHPAIASFGRRPMFDNGPPLLETFLFDFSGDLYGKVLDIAFVRHLRDEQVFDRVEALIAQMDRDSAAARAALGQNP